MGGMVSLTYAGAFPEEVSRLVVLDGVTNYPASRVKPADVRIAEWISDLDKLAQRKIHRYASVADGAERILHRNRHLTREQAMHLATYGLKQNPDGTYGWKFDPYLRARAPLSVVARRPYRAVVAHRVSDASRQRQRKFSARPCHGRRDEAF
jgi:pimeloyl-ACP methyl ester carboxylesterase